MKHIISIVLILVVAFAGVLGLPAVTKASVPSLSLTSNGNDSVQVSVYGDAYASVYLYYQKSGYGTYSQNIGSTNYNGYLSTTISTSSYNISSGSQAYVMVNNQQSSSVSWPTQYWLGLGLMLSESSVYLTTGQTKTITISGGNAPYSMFPGAQGLYMTALSGNSLVLIGQNSGSDTLKICSSNGTQCSNLYISVSGSSNYNQINLNQSSISLNTGATATVSISGSGSYYISSHSNSNVASAYINGSSVIITGNNYGTDNISICGYGNQCATLYVTVGYGYNDSNSTAVTFNQTTVNLPVGQSRSVSMSGGSGGVYYLSYNSNSNSLQASVSGSTLNLYGLSNSATAIVVCSTTTSCGTITVNVGSTGSVLGDQSIWTYCGGENQYCSFYGTQTVRYGANGSYFYKSMSNGVSCSNSVFGDPLFGVVKTCSYGGQY